MAYEIRNNPGNRLGIFADKIEAVREHRGLTRSRTKRKRLSAKCTAAPTPTCRPASAAQSPSLNQKPKGIRKTTSRDHAPVVNNVVNKSIRVSRKYLILL